MEPSGTFFLCIFFYYLLFPHSFFLTVGLGSRSSWPRHPVLRTSLFNKIEFAKSGYTNIKSPHHTHTNI